ncbi:MAG: biliverdin-producing heme oxygenase [Deltaproteobacteria bacterium]|nr:biliverdin-producing heme oxygenase [Deltaproteobacteria bacterium]
MTSAGSDTELLRLADEVRTHAPTIAARVTDATLADPFWTKRYGARGRRRTEEDAAFHVEYLVQALVARDAELVRRYARWLEGLLTTRGMCTLHIDENLARVGAAVVNTVPRAFAIDGYVKAARAALLYPGGAAREIQSAAERVPFALRLHGLAIDQRRKEPLLARDLERIGGTAALNAARARMAFVPAIRTTPAALGVAYVLEGKTLGARFLLEEARARLGLGPQHGAAFLAGYGAETSARWTTYRAALEEYVRADGCRRAIVEAARATFEAFTRTVAVVPF